MGKPPNLYAFQSAAELAPSLRTYVLDAQNAALERHQVFRVAVSGGSLPKTLAQALLKETNAKKEELSKLDVEVEKWIAGESNVRKILDAREKKTRQSEETAKAAS